MAIRSLPAINVDACSGWTPQDLQLYNALPIFMQEREVMYRKKYGNWKMMFGKQPWEPNKGPLGRGVIIEPPPQLRQFAFPNALATACAMKDIIQIRERTFDFVLKHHKFESPTFQWYAAFNDFIEKKIVKNLDFVLQQQEEFTSMFYRGFMFHQSPAMMFADHSTSVIDYSAPRGDGDAAGTTGKSNAYLQHYLAGMGSPGNLSIRSLFYALNVLEEDMKAVPYQSGTLKDDSFLNDKFLLLTSSEAFNNFINDPFLKENRRIDLDIVEEGFKGSILGRITTSLHSNPLRILVASDGSVSFPAPETIEENPASPDFGQTVVNPDYKKTQFEVAFLCGAKGYNMIEVGPPPSEFGSGSGADRIGRLQWNGKPRLTDRMNVPCMDSDGNTQWDPNTYDEFLKIISYLVMGAAAETPRNVLPIVFKRARGITTSIL